MSGMNTTCLRCETGVADESDESTGRFCRNCPGVVCAECVESDDRCPECGSRLRDAPGL
ncbi:hypothetical protein [Halospeciosus flavus]|uniref:RING-type domain-containing protein n=1 Tax=Halospeciosus flavus TaxID=3032283 RepID=A0ABD5Z946_9EURY